MKQIIPVFKREFFGYFRSPIAYVFLIVFLVVSSGLTFYLGRLFDFAGGLAGNLFQPAALDIHLFHPGSGHAPLGGGAQVRNLGTSPHPSPFARVKR